MKHDVIHVGLHFALGNPIRRAPKRCEGYVLASNGDPSKMWPESGFPLARHFIRSYGQFIMSYGPWVYGDNYPCAVLHPDDGWIPSMVHRSMMWGPWADHLIDLYYCKQSLKLTGRTA